MFGVTHDRLFQFLFGKSLVSLPLVLGTQIEIPFGVFRSELYLVIVSGKGLALHILLRIGHALYNVGEVDARLVLYRDRLIQKFKRFILFLLAEVDIPQIKIAVKLIRLEGYDELIGSDRVIRFLIVVISIREQAVYLR